jgi:hypothetical protein
VPLAHPNLEGCHQLIQILPAALKKTSQDPVDCRRGSPWAADRRLFGPVNCRPHKIRGKRLWKNLVKRHVEIPTIPNHHTSNSLDSTIRCSALFNMIPPVSPIVFQVTGRGGVFVPIGLVVACAEGTFLVLYTQNEVHAHRPRGDKPMSFKLVSESMHNLVCQKSLFWTVAKWKWRN